MQHFLFLLTCEGYEVYKTKLNCEPCSYRSCSLLLTIMPNERNDFINIICIDIKPSLFLSFDQVALIDLGNDSNAAADGGGFSLRSAHTTKARGDEDAASPTGRAELSTERVKDSQSSSVDDSCSDDDQILTVTFGHALKSTPILEGQCNTKNLQSSDRTA